MDTECLYRLFRVNSAITLDDLRKLLDLQVKEEGSVDKLLGYNTYSRLSIKLSATYGKGWRSATTSLLEGWLGENPSAIGDELKPSQFANLAALAPSAVERFPLEHQRLSEFSSLDSFTFLQRSENFERLKNFLFDGRERRIEPPSPSLLLAFALSTSVHAHSQEDQILSGLRSRLTSPSPPIELIRKAISARLSNKRRLSQEKHTATGDRVALIIAGQMRSMDVALPGIAKAFDKITPDIFISTWDQPGLTKVEPVRYKRLFSEELWPQAEALSQNQWQQLSASMLAREKIAPNKMRRRIESALPDANLCGINVDKEDHPMFSRMTNHAKMYWHNRFWPVQLGENYLSENYDYVIKVRPDIRLTSRDPFTFDNLRNLGHRIATETPSWKFNTWGLGIGDQVIYGRSATMEPILSTWWDKNQLVPRLVSSVLAKPDLLLGHQNVGLELWLSVSEPARMSFGHGGFYSNKINSPEELDMLLQADPR